jgi:hypothetical protein
MLFSDCCGSNAPTTGENGGNDNRANFFLQILSDGADPSEAIMKIQPETAVDSRFIAALLSQDRLPADDLTPTAPQHFLALRHEGVVSGAVGSSLMAPSHWCDRWW